MRACIARYMEETRRYVMMKMIKCKASVTGFIDGVGCDITPVLPGSSIHPLLDPMTV